MSNCINHTTVSTDTLTVALGASIPVKPTNPIDAGMGEVCIPDISDTGTFIELLNNCH